MDHTELLFRYVLTFSLTFLLHQVPEVYWSLTTPRVLTMEFCEGGKVDNLAYIRTNGISADEVGVC